jgi:hypothetical protein
LSLLMQREGGYWPEMNKRSYVRFEVFTAVTMKNVVFCDIKPNSYFTENTLRLHYRVQPVNAM